jgi:hypothetical protein
MGFYTAVLLDPGALRLIALAERCAHEPASRQLDGEIYCAVHNIEDINLFSDDNLWEAKRNGQVLVPRLVCAVALRARAFTNAPPLRISSAFECRQR